MPTYEQGVMANGKMESNIGRAEHDFLLREFEASVCLNEFSYTCLKCRKTEETVEEMQLHLLQHGNVRHMSCFICDQVLESKRALWEHFKTHQERYCKFCNEFFHFAYALNGHIQFTNHRSVAKKCEKCANVTTTGHKCPQAPMVYTCLLCGEIFPWLSELNEHTRKHGNLFTCQLCGMSDTDYKRMQDHEKSHAKKPERITEKIAEKILEEKLPTAAKASAAAPVQAIATQPTDFQVTTQADYVNQRSVNVEDRSHATDYVNTQRSSSQERSQTEYASTQRNTYQERNQTAFVNPQRNSVPERNPLDYATNQRTDFQDRSQTADYTNHQRNNFQERHQPDYGNQRNAFQDRNQATYAHNQRSNYQERNQVDYAHHQRNNYPVRNPSEYAHHQRVNFPINPTDYDSRGNPIYQCFVCNMHFGSPTELRVHMDAHSIISMG